MCILWHFNAKLKANVHLPELTVWVFRVRYNFIHIQPKSNLFYVTDGGWTICTFTVYEFDNTLYSNYNCNKL